MTRYGINGFNGMNTFPLGAETVSVNRVRDEDLVRFKAESPADFIRIHEAGIDGGGVPPGRPAGTEHLLLR
jgi:hypothetical protein